MRNAWLLAVVLGCGAPPQAGEPEVPATSLRGPPTWVPDASCEPPPPGCPVGDLDPRRCVTAPGLVKHARAANHAILEADLDDDVVADLDLEPGLWWTAIPDPAGQCNRVQLAFHVEERAADEGEDEEGDDHDHGNGNGQGHEEHGNGNGNGHDGGGAP